MLFIFKRIYVVPTILILAAYLKFKLEIPFIYLKLRWQDRQRKILNFLKLRFTRLRRNSLKSFN